MTGDRIQTVLVALKTCKNPFAQLGTISREFGQPHMMQYFDNFDPDIKMKTSTVEHSAGVKKDWIDRCLHLTPPMSFEELNMVWSLWCHTAALIGVPGEPSRMVGGASGRFRSNIRSIFSAPPVSKCVVLCFQLQPKSVLSTSPPILYDVTYNQGMQVWMSMSDKANSLVSHFCSPKVRTEKKEDLRKSTSSDNMLVLKGVKFIPR